MAIAQVRLRTSPRTVRGVPTDAVSPGEGAGDEPFRGVDDRMKIPTIVRSGLCVTMVLMTSLFAASGASAGGGSSPPSGEASLVGRPWRLVTYRTNQGVLSPVVAGTKVTALFDEAGKVGGSARCKQYFAGGNGGGDGIQVGPGGAPLQDCAAAAGGVGPEKAHFAGAAA